MKTTKNPPKEANSKPELKKRTLKIVLILTVIYGIFLFIPGVQPFARFPLYVIKCGKLPLPAYKIAGSNSYNTPEGKNYTINTYIYEYFCTEAEAQAAGYHKDSYDNF